MSRRTTQQELNEKFVDGLGDDVRERAALDDAPLELVFEADPPVAARVYLNTLTASGRSDSELRIQVHLDDHDGSGSYATPDRSDARLVVLAGYNEEYDVFVLWDDDLYEKYSYNQHIQVDRSTLERATDEGLATQEREGGAGGEVVVAATPDFLSQALRMRYRRTRARGSLDDLLPASWWDSGSERRLVEDVAIAYLETDRSSDTAARRREAVKRVSDDRGVAVDRVRNVCGSNLWDATGTDDPLVTEFDPTLEWVEDDWYADKIDLSPRRLRQLSADVTIDEAEIETWLQSLNRKKGAIFYGPPGTGKTFVAQHLAEALTAGSDGEVDIVQFHSAYEYEDFVQGIRPATTEDDITYSVEPGRFVEFCETARERSGPCVLIIDEINRADLSKVFGELMYLLEYRGESVKLAQKRDEDDEFGIPENVLLLGTMNTADRSTALVDFALRRRFSFVSMEPDGQTLVNYHEKHDTGLDVSDVVDVVGEINDAIGERDFYLGYSYFMHEDLETYLPNIWQTEIEPYLEEYFFDERGKVEQFRWDTVEERISL